MITYIFPALIALASAFTAILNIYLPIVLSSMILVLGISSAIMIVVHNNK